MRAAEMKVDIFNDEHMNVSWQRDVAGRLAHVLARTKPVRVQYAWRREVRSDACAWCSSWWARLIRWLCSRRWTHRLVPYPLEALACASEVTVSCNVFRLPDDAVDTIQAQMAAMKLDGRRPRQIVVGYRTAEELLRSRHISLMHPGWGMSLQAEVEFLGCPVLITPNMEEGAVLVL